MKEVGTIKTYNNTLVSACPDCRKEMALTLLIMKYSANELIKSGKYVKATHNGVVMPLEWL